MNRFSIKRTEHISSDTLLLTLSPKTPDDRLYFKAGQYAAVGFTVDGRPSPMRCFSIVSSPMDQDELQFAMRIYGEFTQAVAKLAVGTEMFVRGPFGSFIADMAPERNLVFLTGGIGITPFMSMIRYATQQQSRTPMTLLYSVPTQENIPFYNELLDHEKRNPNLRVFFFVTKGAIDKMQVERVLEGRIAETHLKQLAAARFNQFSYFICGPGSFMSAMQDILSQNQVSPNRIITEEFTPTSSAVTAVSTSRYNAPLWTYGLTSASMVLGIVFIMVLDLIANVPKTVNAQSATSNSTAQTSNPVSTSSSTTTATNTDQGASNSSNSSNPSTDSSSSSTPTTTTTQTSTYAQPTNQYQAPVSSVS